MTLPVPFRSADRALAYRVPHMREPRDIRGVLMQFNRYKNVVRKPQGFHIERACLCTAPAEQRPLSHQFCLIVRATSVKRQQRWAATY